MTEPTAEEREIAELDGDQFLPFYGQDAIDAAVAAERERCAKVCDRRSADHWHNYKCGPSHVRGVAMFEHASDEADACASAIRSEPSADKTTEKTPR